MSVPSDDHDNGILLALPLELGFQPIHVCLHLLMCEVIDFNLYVDNTSHMEYITFYTIKRTAFDILAYFWPELSGKYLHLNITRIYT